MLEYLLIFTRWIICKLIFKNHRYKIVYDGKYYKTYRCIICGKEYDEETKLCAKFYK